MKVLIVLCSVFAVGLGAQVGGYTDQDPSVQEFNELLSNLTNMGLLQATDGYQIESVQTQVSASIRARISSFIQYCTNCK